MEKFCSNCGNELKEGADVCLNCGRKRLQNKPVNNRNDSTIVTIVIISVIAFFVFCLLFPIIIALLAY